ncbi:MAG TPA: transposase [Anaerolineaceae bacterium]|nr:transposase [Anaerolineaceae bacterium]
MQVYLAATPDLSFGDLLRLSLEQEDTVSVCLANTFDQMMDAVKNDPLQLIILDADLCNMDLDAILHQVLQHKPAMKFIVILPENVPEWRPSIPNPVAVLHQPCFITDVVEKVELLMGIHHPVELGVPTGGTADFLEHNNKALAGYILSSFLRESLTHAAMILVNGELRLSRGYLEPEEVREIARIIKQCWPARTHYEVVRYIQLESSRLDYLLYGKEYLQDVFLVLVGDVRDPISEMRTQMETLTRLLQETVDRFDVNQPDLTSSWQVEFPAPNSAPGYEFSGDECNQDAALQREKLLSILSDMPSPDPEEVSKIEMDDQDGRPDILDDFLAEFSDGQEGGITKSNVHPVSATSNTQTGYKKVSLGSTDMGDNRGIISLVLLPRNPVNLLNESLQKQLAGWLLEICQAHGWELVQVQAQPDHLLFSVRTTPGVLPAEVVDILRRSTSARIFTFDNAYRKDNLAGDFWAPGYLVLNGLQAPDDTLLARFTRNTRQKQGSDSLEHE